MTRPTMSTTDRGEPRTGRRSAAVVGYCLSTVLLFLAVVVAGSFAAGGIASLLGAEPVVTEVVGHVLGGVLITSLSIGAVALWHRRQGRALWAEVGLTWDRRTATQLAMGLAISLLVALATATVAALTAGASWGGGFDPGYPWPATFALGLVSWVLVQGFPEELVFRGHLMERLGRWVGHAATVVLSTVTFGVIHVVSNGPVSPVQQACLVAVATAFAFTCAAARHRTGTIWAAVGIHSGLHLWTNVTMPGSFFLTVPAAAVSVIGFVLVGLIFLRGARSQRGSLQDGALGR